MQYLLEGVSPEFGVARNRPSINMKHIDDLEQIALGHRGEAIEH